MIPDTPKHLSRRAKEAWRSLCGQLLVAKIVTEMDMPAIEAMAEAYADYLEATETLEREGMFYRTTTRDGSEMIRAHPAAAIKADCDRRLKAWYTEFGMTASARSRVRTVDGQNQPGKPAADVASKYLS